MTIKLGPKLPLSNPPAKAAPAVWPMIYRVPRENSVRPHSTVAKVIKGFTWPPDDGARA